MKLNSQKPAPPSPPLKSIFLIKKVKKKHIKTYKIKHHLQNLKKYFDQTGLFDQTDFS